MNRDGQKGEVWVEYLFDGTWLMRIDGDKLLGYQVRNDPCNYREDEAPYEEELIPDFKTFAENLGLEPVIVDCIGLLFDWDNKTFVDKGAKA